MADQDRSAMLQKLREKLQKKRGGGGFKRDPGEWRAPQVGLGEEFKAKAYILPPVDSMDGLFFHQVGDHWVNKKRFPCPRVYDNDECSYCQLGFDLLSATEDKKARSELSRAYLPRTQYVVNLYFPDVKSNPDDLRGKVMFYAMPKTIFDKLEECIQKDDAGSDPDDPQPWGIFYDANDAYPLSIVINKKGDYNNYSDSKLLANGRGPLAPTAKKVDEILAQRYDIPTKFPERDADNLKALKEFADALLNGTANPPSSGFDSDETEHSPKSTKPATKPVATKAPKVEVETSEDAEETPAVVENVEDDELQNLLNSIKSSNK